MLTSACVSVHVCIRACVHAYVYVPVVHMQTCRFNMEAMNSLFYFLVCEITQSNATEVHTLILQFVAYCYSFHVSVSH